MNRAEKNMIVVLALVVAMWGVNVVMIKYLTAYMNPMLVSASRILIAGAVLLPFVRRGRAWFRPTRNQWLLLIATAATSIFGHQLLLSYGVMTTSASTSSLILALNPLCTALLAAWLVGEKLSLRLVGGALVGLAGVLVVIFSREGGGVSLSGWGDGIVFLSMLAYVAGGLLVKKMAADVPPLVITAYTTIIGAVMLHGTVLATQGATVYAEISRLPGAAWAVILLSAVGASALGGVGYNLGIRALGANRTSMFLNGMPFASMVGAIVFLNEQLHAVQLVAFVLTVLGIAVGTGGRAKRPATHQAPDPLRHSA